MQTQETIRVSSPAQLLDVVPKLCGFTPTASLVIVGLAGETGQVVVTLRYDLPGPSDIAVAEEIARHAAMVLDGKADALAAVVYGPEEPATLAAAVLAALGEIPVLEMLRVEDGRYWSYICTDPQCCPPEGTPFMAEALPVREEIAAKVAPVVGRVQVVRRAVERESQRVIDMPKRALDVALETVRAAIEVYRTDAGTWDDGNAAVALVGLRSLRVRDDAWSRMEPEHCAAHIQMWTDLTRIAPAGFVVAPASLLAFCAWQAGDGALANVALDRAQAESPDYSMADLLRQVITSGAPPSLARLPMTPAEVAASYAEGQ